jgi:hypothetical protein
MLWPKAKTLKVRFPTLLRHSKQRARSTALGQERDFAFDAQRFRQSPERVGALSTL